MNDEDFVMGYAVGYNDGVGSGGSGGGLDDYPVFPKKFRLGDSDFYFMVGDINSGFYDALNAVNYDSTAGAYTLKFAQWYRYFHIILCKGSERFAVFMQAVDCLMNTTHPVGAGGVYSTTTYYLDDASCTKVTPSSSTGEWRYSMTYKCHYEQVYSDGSYSYTGTTTFSDESLYGGLYFNADGTISRAPGVGWVYNPGGMHCLNDEYFRELMDLMLTVPDIIEEVF